MKIKALLFSSLALLISGAIPAFSEVEEAKKVNGAALSLLQQGKTEESIALWERIPQAKRGAEIRNNLGYAYYLRSRQYFNGSHGDETFYNRHYKEAKSNLVASRKMAPNRWTVHLNLGDLFFFYKEQPEAAAQYKTLLSLNPSYKHAERIRARIRVIERENLLAKKMNFKPLVAEVHPSLPLRVFRLTSGTYEGGSYFNGIDVLVGDDTKVTQTLECELEGIGAMYPVDVNFDGYLDFLALSYTGSGKNYGYCSWLYDKESGAYRAGIPGERDEVELTVPYIDYLKKTVRTSWFGPGPVTTGYYQYRDDRLVLEKEITVETSENEREIVYRRTVKKRMKGKMITESSKVTSTPEEAYSHIKD